MRRPLVGAAIGALLLGTTPAIGSAQQGQPGTSSAQPMATFKSGVEVVTVTAAVRDERGRVVKDLKASDFEVLDTGAARQIRDFYVGESPISLAILLDISGSMAVGGNMNRARQAVDTATLHLQDTGDEAALFTFDSKLVEVVGFTKDLARIRRVSLEG